jgi:hypothetical protein
LSNAINVSPHFRWSFEGAIMPTERLESSRIEDNNRLPSTGMVKCISSAGGKERAMKLK